MDDKRIEDMIRNTLHATPPEGMRERTLRPARQELAKRKSRRHILGITRRQFACVVIVLALATFTNIAANIREERIDAMVCRQSTGSTQTRIAHVMSPQEWQRRQSQIVDSLCDKAGTDPL